MKSSQMMNGLKLTTALLSCLTMVLSPVAMGAEAERMSRSQVENYVVELGLNNKETLGQFWDKSKVYAPANLYADIDAYINANRNMAMPQVTSVTSPKGTDGSEVPTLQMSQGGKTYTVQLFGEKNRYIRINGVNLSENDLIRLRPALARLEASDINVKKEGDKLRQDQAALTENETAAIQYTKDFARFNGFPRITPQMWSSMSKFDRANYIVKMRLLWVDADRVNRAARAPASTAPKKKGVKDQSLLEKIYETVFGTEAYAEARVRRAAAPAVIPVPPAVTAGSPSGLAPDASTAVPVQGTTVRTRTGSVRIPYDAEKCVVAGYIGSYDTVTNRGQRTPRPGCSIDVAIATYANATANGVANNPLSFVKEANDNCAAAHGNNVRWVACNPIIYGYPNGTENCINRDINEMQTATWFDSQPRPGLSCDAPSRLGTSASVVEFTGNDYTNAPARAAQLAALERDQRSATPADDYKLTQQYLQGVLSKRSTSAVNLRALFDDPNAAWNKDLDNALVNIQKQFEDEINRAITTCETSITSRNEPNQKPACDQLHRRWLFTERFIEKIRVNGCLTGSSYIGAYAVSNGVKESSYSGSEAATSATLLNKRAVTTSDKLCQCPGNAAPPAAPAPSSPAPAPVQPTPAPAPPPAGSPATAAIPAVTAAGGTRVALGEQCPLPPSPPPVIPAPVPPPPAPPAATCPGNGVPISVPSDGPFNFCACPRDNNVRVPIGNRVVCPPPQPPPPAPVPPATCSADPNIDNFDYVRCACRSGTLKTKSDGHKVCEGKDNTGLIIAGIGIAGLAAFLLLRGHDHNPKCAAGTTYNAATKVCSCAAIACDLVANDYNAASCSCTPKTVVPPATCPNPVQSNVGGVCQCLTANACTGAQKIYNYETCQCTDKPEPPVCADGSAPVGGVCPTCPDGTPKPAAGCPVVTPPTEGGSGTEVCKDALGNVVSCGYGAPTGR